MIKLDFFVDEQWRLKVSLGDRTREPKVVYFLYTQNSSLPRKIEWQNESRKMRFHTSSV